MQRTITYKGQALSGWKRTVAFVVFWSAIPFAVPLATVWRGITGRYPSWIKFDGA